MIEYPWEFQKLWAMYPKRAGGNPKRKAFKAYQARLNQGYQYDDMHAGVLRYSLYCAATDRFGTEFIMQAATFFGPDERFLEPYDLPRKTEKDELRGMSREQALNYKASKMGLQARVGETMDEYQDRVNAEWSRYKSDSR